MKSSHIVLGAFLVGLLLLIVEVTGSRTSDIAKMEFSILMVRQATGIFISTVAALWILLRALNKASIADVLTLIVALFAGLMLLDASWQLAISLGLVLIGFVSIEVIRVFRPRYGSSAAGQSQSAEDE